MNILSVSHSVRGDVTEFCHILKSYSLDYKAHTILPSHLYLVLSVFPVTMLIAIWKYPNLFDVFSYSLPLTVTILL